jgi:hypothetical protein
MKLANIFCGYAAFVLVASTAAAQSTPYTTTGTCSKPDVEQHVAAGDRPDHVFAIAQGKCKATGTVDGATSEVAVYSEHREITATSVKAWGVYVATYDSGGTASYRFQMSLPIKGGAAQPGGGTFQATLGTGKMKGIKASGTCKYTPGADDVVSYTCSGEYTLAGAPAAK